MLNFQPPLQTLTDNDRHTVIFPHFVKFEFMLLLSIFYGRACGGGEWVCVCVCICLIFHREKNGLSHFTDPLTLWPYSGRNNKFTLNPIGSKIFANCCWHFTFSSTVAWLRCTDKADTTTTAVRFLGPMRMHCFRPPMSSLALNSYGWRIRYAQWMWRVFSSGNRQNELGLDIG